MPHDQSLEQAVLASELPLTAAPLLYVNGFPGVGKLTIAREIVKLLGLEECILLDSHTLIGPVNAQYSQTARKRAKQSVSSNLKLS